MSVPLLGVLLLVFGGGCYTGSLTTHIRERDIILEMRSLIRSSLDKIERKPLPEKESIIIEENTKSSAEKEEEDCSDINAHRFRFAEHDNVMRFRKTMGYKPLVGVYKCKTAPRRRSVNSVRMITERGDTTTVHDSHEKYDHMATPLTVIFFIVFVPGLTVIIILAMIGMLLLLSLKNKLISNMK